MAKDTGFTAVAEQFKEHTVTKKVDSLESLEQTVGNLLDAELSMNLLPLGRKLSEQGDTKYTVLLAEAGRRLANGVGDTTEYVKLNEVAKATILHALDRFISEGGELPEGCTHFDGLPLPSEKQLRALISKIEKVDGIALYAETDEEEEVESEPESESEETVNKDTVFDVAGLELTPRQVAELFTAVTGLPLNEENLTLELEEVRVQLDTQH